MRCEDPQCVELHRHLQILDTSITAELGTDAIVPPPPPEERPIDRIITPADVTTEPFIAGSQESIFVIGTQGAKVTVIRDLEPFAATLKTLVLRSNLISSISGIESLTNLEKLELYDNCIEALPVSSLILAGQNLQILDLSFNSIRSMEAVASCPLLKELYVAQNKLKVIEGVNGLVHLEILDLGANRIRELPPNFLANCVALKSLWLGKNKIERIGVEAGLANLTNLTKLDVQNNRLLRIGLGELPLNHSLQELYLACNGISEFLPEMGVEGEGGDGSVHQLQTLDLSRNPIKDLSFVTAFADSLEELWLTGIAVDNKEQILPLANLKHLSCVYLEHSPLQKSLSEPEYKNMLKTLAPTLTQIDALIG